MANTLRCWFPLIVHGDGVATETEIDFGKHLALTHWYLNYDAKPPNPNSALVTQDGNSVFSSINNGKIKIITAPFTGPKTFMVTLIYNV